MKHHAVCAASLLAVGIAMSGFAMAAPVLCSDTSDGSNATSTPPEAGVTTTGLDVSDVTFRSNNADDCYGVVTNDNDTAADITAIGAWGGDWLLAARDNKDGSDTSSTIGGINFVLSSSAGTSGTWTLTWTDTNGGSPLNFPVSFDFVVVPKASDNWAAYFFDDEVLQASPNSGNGTFEINFLNNGGQIPNLSHLSLYVQSGEEQECTGPDCGPQQIPEPGSLVLLALGLLAAGVGGRRRLQNNA